MRWQEMTHPYIFGLTFGPVKFNIRKTENPLSVKKPGTTLLEPEKN